MFFYFSFVETAAEAFKKALKSEGITYEEFAKRIGISRGTLTKFIGGRPLTSDLLASIIKGLPEDQGKNILVGHLRDEIVRAGFSQNQFQISEKTQYSYLVDHVTKLLHDDPDRVADLAKLAASWESKGSAPSSKRLRSDSTKQ